MANKKMNLGSLKKIESKQFTQKKIIVGDFEVLIDQQFKKSKILALLKEFLEKDEYTKKNNINMDVLSYLFILCIKYFTDIDMGETFEEQIFAGNVLVDMEYMDIISEAFDENEMKKIAKTFEEFRDNVEKLAEEMKKEKELKNSEES